ncbi:hypothetical protein [Pseudomonas sp. CGJS7]|uniref:hypothetical protein n=1 Tax=Pseudomonas sp. CGJS7 TaxID=3109348 RepID=UPI00300921BC
MSAATSPEVIAFRIDRLRRAPMGWTIWVALFTAINGFCAATNSDFMIPAGLTLPFSIAGGLSHFIAAGLFVVLAVGSKKVRPLLYVSALIYLLDTVFSVYVQIWMSVVMHLVVIGFVLFALGAARGLADQQAKSAAKSSQLTE